MVNTICSDILVIMLKLLLALIVVTGAECNVKTDCKISLSNLPAKEPLYLTRKNSRLEFVVPQNDKESSKKEKGTFELAENEELILACPGESNKLVKQPQSVAKSRCLRGTRFSLGGQKSFDIQQLECMDNVKAVLRPNFEKQCAKTGVEMEIGFEVESQFLPLISLCHDIKAADTLFVEHDIPATIRKGRYVVERPFFADGPSPLYKGVKTSKVYSKAYQKQLFDRLLGEGQGEKINGLHYLARGHLAPHADFLYGTWQWSTYFYANAVPQWQIINAGNWLALEKYLRKLAAQTKQDLHIITGTYGVLALSSNTGKKVEIYLEPEGEKKIRVPAALFKMIRSKQTDAAIVVVCSNNPFDKVPELCQNIAADYKWPTAWDDYTKGQMYFCDIKSFFKNTKIPLKIKYSRILQGIGEQASNGKSPSRNKDL